MKKTFLILTAVVALAATSFTSGNFEAGSPQDSINPAGRIKIILRGSEALYPSFRDLAQGFNKKQTKYYIDVRPDGIGSTMGMMSLLEGQSQIALTSREITDNEKEEFKSLKREYVEKPVGREAFVIVVNKENPVSHLTTSQVSAIFAGKITNWKMVGGTDEIIRVFIRTNTSSSYKQFKEFFFAGKSLDYSENSMMMKTYADMKRHLTSYDNGIGFMGYSAYSVNNHNKDLKAIKICEEDKSNCIAPSRETIAAGTYGLNRYCYMYYNKNEEGMLKEFIEYVDSEEGQKILIADEFIPDVKKL